MHTHIHTHTKAANSTSNLFHNIKYEDILLDLCNQNDSTGILMGRIQTSEKKIHAFTANL